MIKSSQQVAVYRTLTRREWYIRVFLGSLNVCLLIHPEQEFKADLLRDLLLS